MNSITKPLRFIENVFGVIGGLFLVIVSIIILIDTTSRYVFSFPFLFTYQLIERYLLVSIMTLPMAWAFREGAYIRVVGFTEPLPPLARQLVLRCGLLLSFVYVSMLAVLSFQHFLQVFLRGDTYMGVYDWPVWLSWVSVPIGTGLLALRVLACAFGPTEDLHRDPAAEENRA